VSLVLASSGLLHLAGSCRATGYTFTVGPGEELLGFLYLPFRRLCHRCFRPASGERDIRARTLP
jgi:hypothetical protein